MSNPLTSTITILAISRLLFSFLNRSFTTILGQPLHTVCNARKIPNAGGIHLLLIIVIKHIEYLISLK
jgi:hypothetical protein